jgi:hypothetical protein
MPHFCQIATFGLGNLDVQSERGGMIRCKRSRVGDLQRQEASPTADAYTRSEVELRTSAIMGPGFVVISLVVAIAILAAVWVLVGRKGGSAPISDGTKTVPQSRVSHAEKEQMTEPQEEFVSDDSVNRKA